MQEINLFPNYIENTICCRYFTQNYLYWILQEKEDVLIKNEKVLARTYALKKKAWKLENGMSGD